MVAQAWTGGLTSLKFHSYAGIWPDGCRYDCCSISSSWRCAKVRSTEASATQWKARSQSAYQGYSHLSGIEITSSFTMWNHSWFRIAGASAIHGKTPCSASHWSVWKL